MDKQEPISFFNWSLNKILKTESSELNKAKIKILSVIIVLALFKVIIAMYYSFTKNNDFQFYRALVVGVAYLFCLKLVLYDSKFLKPVTHTMLIFGVLIIWSISIVSKETIYIINIQFIFMAIISSFYLLNSYWGIRYSLLSSVPPLLLLTLKELGIVSFNFNVSVITFPENLLISILNFLTIIYASYMYHITFQKNIDDKEKLNEDLKLAVESANRLARTKTEFLSTMSHELRTPLNAVIGITDLLLSNDYKPDQEENLKTLKYSGNNLRNLINNVLDFNKLDLNKIQVNNHHSNLYDITNHIFQSFQYEAILKNLNLELKIDESLKNKDVLIDSVKLNQILYNLIGNSIKYTKEGSVLIELRIVSEDEKNLNVEYKITDTGIGIKKEDQEKIFEPFEQLNQYEHQTGTGLGLSIVKRILSLYQSNINLYSEPSVGSTFSFNLILEKSRVYNLDYKSKSSEKDLSNLKILVAEDNQVNAFLVKRLLDKWNCQYKIVENGKLALEEVMNSEYDLILMDINMPIMDGFEASAEIRKLPNIKKSNIHIIALTASSDDKVIEQSSISGINEIVIKPFDTEMLYQKLKLISDSFSTISPESRH